MKTILTSLAALFLVFSTFANDVLILNNEMAFKGKIVRIKDCAVVFKTEGEKYVIPASEILALRFADTTDKVYSKYLQLGKFNPENCLKGRTDAELFHGKEMGHMLLGALFGPFAVIGTLASNPLPHRGKRTYQMSENRELFKDPAYLVCYRKKAKWNLIKMELFGWGSFVLMYFLIVNYG